MTAEAGRADQGSAPGRGLPVEEGLRALQLPPGVDQAGVHRLQLLAGVRGLEVVLQGRELGGPVTERGDRLGRRIGGLGPIGQVDDQVRGRLDFPPDGLLALGLGDARRRGGRLALARRPPEVEPDADQPHEGHEEHDRQDAPGRPARRSEVLAAAAVRGGTAARRALDAQRVGGAEHPGGEGVGAVGGVDGGQLGAVDLRRLTGDVRGDAHVPWVEHDDATPTTERVEHLAGEGPGAGRGVDRLGQHDDLRVAVVRLQLGGDAVEVGDLLSVHGAVLERDVVRAQVARRGVDALRVADRRRQHHCCQGRSGRCDHAEAGHVLRLLPSSGQEPNAGTGRARLGRGAWKDGPTYGVRVLTAHAHSVAPV